MKNVILLTVDVLRKDALGLYGSDLGLTPFLDSLKDKSLVFTRHHASGPYTQASFPGILASSYFLEYGDPKQLSPKRTLVSEVLKHRGVATAAFHSNAYLSAFAGWNRGWDHFYDSMQEQVADLVPYVRGHDINRKVDSWLEVQTGLACFDDVLPPKGACPVACERNSQLSKRLKADSPCKPLFLWVHYMDVHEPYVPDEKYLAKIAPDMRLSRQEMFAMFKQVILPRDASDPQKVETLKKLYHAHVIEVDEHVREFFGVLQRHGILGDCTVIITSDHGDEFGEHGGLSHDGKMYSELINVPLIVYDSDRNEGKTVETVTSGVDIAPTIDSLSGAEAPEKWHGQALLPLENYASKGAFGEAVGKLTHKAKDTDRPVYFYREDNLKIIHRMDNDTWELYDLDEDPGEKNNIVASSGAAEPMKKRLNAEITWQPPK